MKLYDHCGSSISYLWEQRVIWAPIQRVRRSFVCCRRKAENVTCQEDSLRCCLWRETDQKCPEMNKNGSSTHELLCITVFVRLCGWLMNYLWFVGELDGIVTARGVCVLHVNVVLVAGTCVV